jgi:hypothetical protein
MRCLPTIILLTLALTACQDAGTGPEAASSANSPVGTTCSLAEDASTPACDGPEADAGSPAILPPEPAVEPIGTNPRDAVMPTPTSLAEGLFSGANTSNLSADCPAAIPWFFENPAAECASTVLNSWTVMQPFEGGLMVWTQEGGLTYVLVDDGSPFKPYAVLLDTVGIPMPEPDPAIAPPPDLTQPVLGLAKFWRGLVPGSEWVRDSLGWATAPEAGYSALWQCNDTEGNTARCYFTGPQDEIIAITQGDVQFWTYVQGAVR